MQTLSVQNVSKKPKGIVVVNNYFIEKNRF